SVIGRITVFVPRAMRPKSAARPRLLSFGAGCVATTLGKGGLPRLGALEKIETRLFERRNRDGDIGARCLAMRHASAYDIAAGEFRRREPGASVAQYVRYDIADRRRSVRRREADDGEFRLVDDIPAAEDRAARQLMRQIDGMLDMRGMRCPAAGCERQEQPEPHEPARPLRACHI